ncbi:thermonuclease family protein [Rhizobium sp. 'Codium 1']|uniref:thermonuclease family protein n=1 Tax=Rhizobium sp. 'Codium 1' TaxID=2940484 RepID=UPI001E34C701|nr:thermonuclease family protein [Rhizobium sp. 'Codium 1']MCC8933208.1 thermonuclease family protein [Rhizobium sp. 'Codium 1']
MFRPRAVLIRFLAAVSLGSPVSTEAHDLYGPVKADIVRVIDGDTILVDALPWPNQRIRTYVRLRGIDSAEMNSPCPAFRRSANLAKQALITMVEGRESVTLTAITGDKYFGRVVATLKTDDGRDLARELMERGLAEPYEGKRKLRSACPG